MSCQAMPAASLVGCLKLQHHLHLFVSRWLFLTVAQACGSSPPLCTSFVIRSSGFCKFICAWRISPPPSQLSYLVLNPLFNSWFMTELVLLLLLLPTLDFFFFFFNLNFSEAVRMVPKGILGGSVESALVFAHLFKLENSWMSSVGCFGLPVFSWINKYWIMISKWCYCCVIAIVKNTK